MKKFFIFFVMSIICLDVWSQAKLKTQYKFGFKLGCGMHTITGSPVKTHPRGSFMGGIWFQIKMSKNWTLQSELTYIDKGTGRYRQDHPKYGDYWLVLSYYEVPILFQYNKKKGYIEFGPGLAAFSNASEISIGVALPYDTGLYPFNKKDFSFNLGAGYVFNEKWRVGLRLTHSLLPVRKQLPGTSHPMYNRGIVLAVSRQINLKASKTKQSQDIE
ncbi:MAG: PorT family protein [Bacteroidetes bacterium]|nr:PorT family protein [Bacteroidota bacterium]